VQVRALFLGIDTADAAAEIAAAAAAAGGGNGSNGGGSEWRVTSAVAKAKLVIEFEPDAPSPYAAGGSDCVRVAATAAAAATTAADSVGNGRADADTAAGGDPLGVGSAETNHSKQLVLVPRDELIADLPLGLRLLNSIRMGAVGADRSMLRLKGRGDGWDGGVREGREISVKVGARSTPYLEALFRPYLGPIWRPYLGPI